MLGPSRSKNSRVDPRVLHFEVGVRILGFGMRKRAHACEWSFTWLANPAQHYLLSVPVSRSDHEIIPCLHRWSNAARIEGDDVGVNRLGLIAEIGFKRVAVCSNRCEAGTGTSMTPPHLVPQDDLEALPPRARFRLVSKFEFLERDPSVCRSKQTVW
jgi:hypothetical protein